MIIEKTWLLSYTERFLQPWWTQSNHTLVTMGELRSYIQHAFGNFSQQSYHYWKGKFRCKRMGFQPVVTISSTGINNLIRQLNSQIFQGVSGESSRFHRTPSCDQKSRLYLLYKKGGSSFCKKKVKCDNRNLLVFPITKNGVDYHLWSLHMFYNFPLPSDSILYFKNEATIFG